MEKSFESFAPSKNPFLEGTSKSMIENIRAGIASAERVDILKTGRAKIRLWKYAAAASILFCLGISLYIVANKNRQNDQIIATDFKPGGDKATLTLSNGSTIVLNDAKNGTIANQSGISVSKTKAGEIVYSAPSSKKVDDGKILYNTIITPRGGQYQVVLADGSKVWLNAYSSIKFPAAFRGRFREVETTGEVYFEVAKNKAKPFKVKSRNQVVEVLGTHFNINSYADEPEIRTTLIEGAVKVHRTNNNISTVLIPGQEALNNPAGSILVRPADIEQAIAWKSGLFQINDADIETIMRQVSRWYDVEIEYQGKIPKRKFSGKIKRDVKASEFLEMLSFFDVHFSMQGRKIIVKK
ncbi:FecR family protein [Pedobacter ginsenosidimutans]|nr:FecR family protein [Pedobacter ginsenosidimutans]